MIESCLQENKIKIQNGQRDLKAKEAYIKQDYPPGESVEFDWGEVTLNIKELGREHRMKIGVFTFKYSDYRWAALYTNENT